MQSVVHIIDDDPQVRGATSFLLRSLGYATQIYADGMEFLQDAHLDQGCILLDLRMPRLSGLQVQEELARRGVSLPVVVLSGHGDVATAVEAMRLGALDFIEKPYDEQRLLSVIQKAVYVNASSHRAASARAEALGQIEQLSPREKQVMQGVLGGFSNKLIARRLDLSPRTVEMYRANMMEKLGAECVSEVVRVALDAGMQPLSTPEGA